MSDVRAYIAKNEFCSYGVYELELELPCDVEDFRGGQFANISVGGEFPLRRPLCIMGVDGTCLKFRYAIVGRGTKALSQKRVGERVNVLYPLGNGFDIDRYDRIAAIGGGVGIYPLIATIDKNCKEKSFFSYMGFRDKEAVSCLDELSRSERLVVTTDDGSYGKAGSCVDAFVEDLENINPQCIISCGPPPMYRAMKRKFKEIGLDIPCLVSMEERMGCGLGACLACVCRGADGRNLRVCKDGPVFEINELEL